MLLTTKKANKESKYNSCRKRRAATTPLAERSKGKAWTEKGLARLMLSWDGVGLNWCLCWWALEEEACGMDSRPLKKERCCCRRQNILLPIQRWNCWVHPQKPPAAEALREKPANQQRGRNKFPSSSSFEASF